jgi:NADH-quinone oxidoreductase subunit A
MNPALLPTAVSLDLGVLIPVTLDGAGVASLAVTELDSYLPIALVVMMAIGFAVANLIGTSILGPSRDGKVKGQPFESGMNPIGTARKRFNVRFYLIAMVFLVFDVEVVFLYPWAATFPSLSPYPNAESLVWLGRILFFLLTTVVAYAYGYKKGVFKFD